MRPELEIGVILSAEGDTSAWLSARAGTPAGRRSAGTSTWALASIAQRVGWVLPAREIIRLLGEVSATI